VWRLRKKEKLSSNSGLLLKSRFLTIPAKPEDNGYDNNGQTGDRSYLDNLIG